MEDQETDLCIVCSSKVKVNCGENNFHLLSSNLNVIFLLRNLLQVPDSQLEENLRECGDPVEWIRVCDHCSQLNSQAEKLHWKIVRTTEQFRSVQQLILEKTKAPSPPSQLSIDKKSAKWKRREIWRKTTAFISSHDHGTAKPINPFIEGDKLANYLESQQNSIKHGIKVEMDLLEEEYGEDNHCDVEEDTEWEPPPPEVDDSESESVEDNHQNSSKSTKKLSSIPKRSRKRFKYEILNGKFNCPSCDKVFVSRKTVHQHVKDKHSSSSVALLCKLCGKKYATQMSLAVHIKVVHNKQLKRSCHLCSRRFAGQYQLNVHLLSRHKDDPATLKLVEEKGYQLVKCPIPRCTFLKIKPGGGMDEHMKRVHSSDNYQPKPLKRFPCKFCPRIFSQKEYLHRHQLVLHDNADEKPFKCDICGLPSSSPDHLTAHMRRIHKIRKQKITCGSGGTDTDKLPTKHICHLCGFKCRGSTAIKNHMVSKHRDEPSAKQLIEKGFDAWRCKVRGCSAKYTNKPGLDEHVTLMHGGIEDEDKLEMSYFCAFCGKGFFVEEALQRHERVVHDGDKEGDDKKRFKCELCGFETTRQAYLKRHVQRVHKPSKKVRGEVKGDKVIHDKEKVEQPHPCDICGRAYSTHESMCRHKRKIHKIYRRAEESRSTQ